MSIRLLFLTAETCPTFRADVAVLFGKYLPRHGVYSDIVTGRAPSHEGPVQWGGGEVFLCDVRGGQFKKHIKTLVHGIKHLFAADRARYQAIQVRDMPVLATFGLLAARLKRLPFYYWMSFPIPEGQIALARERGFSAGLIKFLFPWMCGRLGRFLLYRVVLPGADHVFVQSVQMKQDMMEKGVEQEKMTPVPMGVDLESVKPEEIPPSDTASLQGNRLILYLGSLDRPRHIEVLFEMLSLVRREIPNALLALVGDTEDDTHRAWLKRQAETAGVAEHVLWSGWLPMREGWRYVRAAEVGLSPIPRGPLLDVSSPTKVPEYLAFGLPVVTTWQAVPSFLRQ
jgi:glycosyltransferase involved in cell wall biosynthesis